MKLRDLARSSRNPPSFMAAFHILRSRFRNRETASGSRKSHESVPRSSSALPLLTFLQQSTVVPVLDVLHRPRDFGPPVGSPIRTHHGDRNFHRRTCHGPVSLLCFLIFEQNQHRAYREVLIAGDLSTEDEGRAIAHNGKYTVSRPQMDLDWRLLIPYQGLSPDMGQGPK